MSYLRFSAMPLPMSLWISLGFGGLAFFFKFYGVLPFLSQLNLANFNFCLVKIQQELTDRYVITFLLVGVVMVCLRFSATLYACAFVYRSALTSLQTHLHEELFSKTQSTNLALTLQSHLFGSTFIAFFKRALHLIL